MIRICKFCMMWCEKFPIKCRQVKLHLLIYGWFGNQLFAFFDNQNHVSQANWSKSHCVHKPSFNVSKVWFCFAPKDCFRFSCWIRNWLFDQFVCFSLTWLALCSKIARCICPNRNCIFQNAEKSFISGIMALDLFSAVKGSLFHGDAVNIDNLVRGESWWLTVAKVRS